MIQLTKELALSADEHCYILGKPRTRPGKGVALDNPRYYPTAAQAVSAALNLTMRTAVADGSITTLRGFIQKQEAAQAELQRHLAPLR